MSDQDSGSGDAQKITGEATVLEVGDGRRPWKSQKGAEFIGYRVKLRLEDGREVGNVEVNTKQDNPKYLAVGETVFGVFDPRPGHQFGPRFQRKSRDGGRRGGGGKSPEEQARIQRQHSQEMAIRIAVSAGWFGGLDPGIGEPDKEEHEQEPSVRQARSLIAQLLNGPVKRLTDYLDQDIERGAKAALERRQQSGSQQANQ